MRARRAARALTNLYDELLRPLGIEVSQLNVLVAVAHFGEAGVTVGRLADVVGLDRTTLTRNLGPLEKAGWIRVARSPTDARSRIVLLTRSGERVIEAAHPLWQTAQERVRDRVGKARVEALRGELDHVAMKVEADGGEPPRKQRGARRRA